MATTQSDIDAMEKALYSGASSVTFPDGRRVDYRTVDELKAAIGYAKNELAGSAGTRTPQSYASFSKD